MRSLIVFNHVSLDGYFVDAEGQMSWAKTGSDDPEWNTFVSQNASGDGTLLFGRITYEMMASFWPTPVAKQHAPEVADGMNRMPKVVFSRTMKEASWNNTKLVKHNLIEAVRKMKSEPGSGMVLLGSGTIISQLAQENLIDEYRVVVNPLILGKGRTMFEGMRRSLSLKLTESRSFKNGNVVLCYEPA